MPPYLDLLPYPAPREPLQARGPYQYHVCQRSSTVGFIIATCCFCSARPFPCASKLAHSLGQSPIPRHLRSLHFHLYRAQPSAHLLASKQLPRHSLSDLYMCRLWLSVIPGTPQTASHPFSLLLGLFITREPRIPFSKCLLIT